MNPKVWMTRQKSQNTCWVSNNEPSSIKEKLTKDLGVATFGGMIVPSWRRMREACIVDYEVDDDEQGVYSCVSVGRFCDGRNRRVVAWIFGYVWSSLAKTNIIWKCTMRIRDGLNPKLPPSTYMFLPPLQIKRGVDHCLEFVTNMKDIKRNSPKSLRKRCSIWVVSSAS